MILTDVIFGQEKEKINLTPNLFIGGVASEINTKATLAVRLNIPETSISYFEIKGEDIAASINVIYDIPVECFKFSTRIRYWIDTENVNAINTLAFHNTNMVFISTSAKILKDQNVIRQTEGRTMLFADFWNVEEVEINSLHNLKLKYLNLKKCIKYGETVDSSVVFNNFFDNLSILANPSMETIKAGNIEGDLQYAIDNGQNVVFSTTNSFLISNVSASDIKSVSAKINFTKPDNIEFYLVYSNGFFDSYYFANEDIYAVNLLRDSVNSIQVVGVDLNFNKHESEIINITTTNIKAIQKQQFLKAYYKYNELSGNELINHISAGVNGVNTNVVLNSPGKINKSYEFVGDSKVTIPDSNDFTFSENNATIPFSFRFLLKPLSGATNVLIAKRTSSTSEYQVTLTGRQIDIIFSEPNIGNRCHIRFDYEIELEKWQEIFIVSSGDPYKTDVFISNTRLLSKVEVMGSYVSMKNTTAPVYIGADRGFLNYLRAFIDQTAIWKNIKLNPSDIAESSWIEN